MSKPLASLSLDLDNKWSYMKTHGDQGWEEFPSYLSLVCPRVVDFFAERDLTITFFVVGQDAAIAENHEPLRMLADAGHEIGNHSFHHEPWLHLYDRQQVQEELQNAQDHILKPPVSAQSGFVVQALAFRQSLLKRLILWATPTMHRRSQRFSDRSRELITL